MIWIVSELPPNFSAAKVKGNGFQSVSAQRAGVQDFKDGAGADEREGYEA